jgi:Pentapeptide repeats (8 copies)
VKAHRYLLLASADPTGCGKGDARCVWDALPMPRWLPNSLVAGIVIIAFAASVVAFFLLPSLVVGSTAFVGSPTISAEAERLHARNEVRTAGVALLGLFGVIVGSVLTWRTVRLTRDGQLTDRYARGVEGLASREEPAQLGAIYALEGVARTSPRDHWPIMSQLVEYLRGTTGPWRQASGADPVGDRAVPATVDAVAGVIGRRHSRWDRGGTLNLAALDLRNVDLAGADLREANLSKSNLSGAFLQGARLDGASLVDALFYGSHLDDASLRGADLTDAHLENARLNAADLHGATLIRIGHTGTIRLAKGLPAGFADD